MSRIAPAWMSVRPNWRINPARASSGDCDRRMRAIGIEIVEGDPGSSRYAPLFRLAQLVSGSADDDFPSVIEGCRICLRSDFWTIVDQRQHDNAEGGFKRCVCKDYSTRPAGFHLA